MGEGELGDFQGYDRPCGHQSLEALGMPRRKSQQLGASAVTVDCSGQTLVASGSKSVEASLYCHSSLAVRRGRGEGSSRYHVI